MEEAKPVEEEAKSKSKRKTPEQVKEAWAVKEHQKNAYHDSFFECFQ